MHYRTEQPSEIRAREVKRYANPVFCQRLAHYLELRRQMRIAKLLLAAVPPAGPKWSAWTRYVMQQRNLRAAAVPNLLKRIADAKAALGPPMHVWKPRAGSNRRPSKVRPPSGRGAQSRLARDHFAPLSVQPTLLPV